MRWTRREVDALLKARGIRLKRSLGQHFLCDDNFLDALVRDAGVGRGDGVVEIGAGIGNLTERLAGKAGRVWAFETDERLIPLLKETLDGRSNVELIHADGAGFERHVEGTRRLKVVSNLPYSDWRRLMLKLLSTRLDVESCTLMLQRDVCDRLRAKTGTKAYGPMAVLLQGACELRVLRRASKSLFHPRPRVDSTVIQVRRCAAGLDFEAAERILRGAFSQRRKRSGLAGGRRVEELPPKRLLADLCGVENETVQKPSV